MATKAKLLNRKVGADTRLVEQVLRKDFPDAAVDAYRYNSVSIRVRILDTAFEGKNRVQRESLVLPVIRRLPQEIQDDITILLLLTPTEHRNKESMLDLEFEHPTRSRL